jgi:hypothetical protein
MTRSGQHWTLQWADWALSRGGSQISLAEESMLFERMYTSCPVCIIFLWLIEKIITILMA